MDKIWFIEINGKAEGPYSILELKRDPRITPDTLVWREGFQKWTKMRHVPELKEVFEDEKSEDTFPPPKDKEKPQKPTGKDELAIDLRRNIPPYVFWLLMTALLISYFIYRMYQDR